MKAKDGRFAGRLAILVLVKSLFLGVLWWAFVRDAQVNVDPSAAFTHLVARTAVPGEKP